jgi:hypothetical protein
MGVGIDCSVLTSGVYCYSIPHRVEGSSVFYQDTFFVKEGTVKSVERSFSTGMIVHPAVYGTSFEQIYHYCSQSVAPVASSAVDSLVIETNQDNILIR